MDELGEAVAAQGGLREAVAAAGAHAEAAEFEAGLAEDDLVHRGAFGGGLGAEQPGWSQRQGAGGESGTFEELAAVEMGIHGMFLR